MKTHCYACGEPGKILSPRGYCADCSNMQVLRSVRASKSLPLLKTRAQGWSDKRIAFEMDWIAEQYATLEQIRKARERRAKAAS